ncbi:MULTISPECIES: PLD nuclease N-terminal domain-containing protein [unclassified Pseudomonas]|uniref:PLD nuclease N-terminal domain-containing protein n=1 Tax=unclassified Pseudomonas TaxID=196821 RepID=UPI000BA4C11A|nr:MULTISPECIES: PLD nuclease N-terminal domain-containing protein [unclassified Pseudomonas]
MSISLGSILFDLIAFVIFALDIWAIFNVVKSNADTLKKVLWVALVAFLPVLGLIIWALTGPRGNIRLPSSN